MDSFACDLLVHITAPSNVKDDKRYATIAQSILEFQPVTRTKVTSHASPSPSPPSDATDEIERVSRQEPWVSIDDASSTWIQAHDDTLALGKQHRPANPLTSNDRSLPLPMVLVEKSFSKREQHLDLSNLQRPRTAPENRSPSFEGGVSFNRPSHKRAHSELSSFTSSFSTVPNSVATPKSSDPRFRSDEVAADALKTCAKERSTSRGRLKRKRQRIAQDTGTHGDLLPVEVARDTLPAGGAGPTTPKRPHSIKKNISPQNESRSVSSTLSPSQPLRLGEVEHLTTPPQIPTVDLTTSLREEMHSQNMNVEESSKSPQMVAKGDRFCEQNVGQNFPEPEHDTRIRELEDEINAPDPPGGQRHFTTHITKTYERLSQRISISKVFRPVHVARDVRVLERGYWLFYVRIGTEDTVAHSRRTLSQEERRLQLCRDLEAPTVDERLTKFDGNGRSRDIEACKNSTSDAPLWTETEFTTFWENTSQFIRDGKAGWGSRVVKKAKDAGVWEITFFCWAEVLGHTWLALWILSDKLIGRVPMTWNSGDGTAVVKMSGQKKGKGNLEGRKGSWVKKEDGEFGCWGLSEE